MRGRRRSTTQAERQIIKREREMDREENEVRRNPQRCL
jgi:hypothetical protein